MKKQKLLLTDDEFAYLFECMGGCINDSLKEEEGTSSLSRTKLKVLYKKIVGEKWERT